MRSNVNPNECMLNAFKRYVGDDFEKMFLKSLSIELNMKKLNAFCYSIIYILELKGVSCNTEIAGEKLCIVIDGVVCMSYNVDFIEDIHTVQRLKFQLMIEWGMALKHTSPKKCEQLLLAL